MKRHNIPTAEYQTFSARPGPGDFGFFFGGFLVFPSCCAKKGFRRCLILKASGVAKEAGAPITACRVKITKRVAEGQSQGSTASEAPQSHTPHPPSKALTSQPRIAIDPGHQLHTLRL